MHTRITNASDNNRPIINAYKDSKTVNNEQLYEKDYGPITKGKRVKKYACIGLILITVLWAIYQAVLFLNYFRECQSGVQGRLLMIIIY